LGFPEVAGGDFVHVGSGFGEAVGGGDGVVVGFDPVEG
jgi:hypothetical protein